MDEPTKGSQDNEPQKPEQTGGEMYVEAVAQLRQKEAGDSAQETGGDNADEESVDLSDLAEGQDIEEWKAQKEKGIAKVVNRAKEREAEAQHFLDNKAAYTGLAEWWQTVANPATREQALKELAERLDEGYPPEHESDETLMESVAAQTSAETRRSTARSAFDNKVEESYGEAALAVAASCNGYRPDKDVYRQALAAFPQLEPEQAVKVHCSDAIQRHVAEIATGAAPKKQEIVGSSTVGHPAAPETDDYLENSKYVQALNKA